MNISQTGLALIKHFEGYFPKPYLCPAGVKTIGYGHVIWPGETYTHLTESQATQLLLKDLYQAERAVKRLIKTALTQGQFDALVSFTFNLGSGSLQRSTLRRKINRGDHKDAPAEFLKWSKCHGRVLRGLLRRRQAEARLYCAA